MGLFCCCDPKEIEEEMNLGKSRDSDSKQTELTVFPNNSKLSPGARLNARNNYNIHANKVTSPIPKALDINIASKIFTFNELAIATRNFSPECYVGEGGFGHVYKGFLQTTGQIVAVKQLDREGLQGDREFLVEVLMLSLLHHPNLVNLIGYCADGDQRLLVYEYMPLGSLEDHLHDLPSDKEALDWNTRIKIAVGAAKGLEYLHTKANPPVIYRDLKSANILLDDGFHPKLSDFGLAKLGPVGDKSHVSTRVMGTHGYCAPEYAMTGQLTIKSDVYCFGVVFLELLTGQSVIDTNKVLNEQNLIKWARPMLNDRRKFHKLVDPSLKGRYPIRGLYQALAIASMCLQEQAPARPVIADIVTALSYIASQPYDHTEKEDRRSHSSRNGSEEKMISAERGPISDHKCEINGIEREVTPGETVQMSNWDSEREQAVVEAKMWGENWRGKHQNVRESSNGVKR